nr:ATP-binding protein [uncultured Sediminibacterium sp.]
MEDIQINVAKPYHDIDTPFSISDNGALAEYVINDPDLMPQLSMGATVLIRDKRKEGEAEDSYGDFWYAGRIVGLKSVSPFNPERSTLLYQKDDVMDPNKPLDAINGPHTHQPMVIQVFLSRELSGTPDNFTDSALQRPPSGYSRLFFPDLEKSEGNQAPTLRDVLRVPHQGLDLGMIGFGNKPYGWKDNNWVSYKWNIDQLDNKHIFIVGESGSGKTVFLKNLAYEIMKHTMNKEDGKRNRVILTDVQGDITQLLFPEFVPKTKSIGWQPVISEEEYHAAQKVFGNFRLIIPITKDSTNADVEELKVLAYKKKNIDVKLISLRFQDLEFPSNAEYLFRSTSILAAPLLDDLAEGLRANGQKPSLARLVVAISRLLSKNPGNLITVQTSGVAYNRVTFEAARRILGDLENYFDMDPLALEQERDPLEAFDNDGTTIFYLDHLNQEERFIWEMQLVAWLYKKKRDLKNTYVFFDEAHQIIPATKASTTGRMGEVFDRLRSNFEKLAREGRKFRLNLVLSTQNPQDLHPIVPEQCPTRIVMKINPRNAGHAFLDKELALIANSFSHGQFWIQSPFNGTPDWVRVHSVAPPVPHDSMENFRTTLETEAAKKI